MFHWCHCTLASGCMPARQLVLHRLVLPMVARFGGSCYSDDGREFNLCIIITARKRSLGQGNIFSSMCQEFCTQGGSASVHAGIPPSPTPDTPQTRHPQTRHPLEQTPSLTRHPLDQALPPDQAAPPEQASPRHPPEQTPTQTRHPQSRHPPDQAPPGPGTPCPPVQCMLGDMVNKQAVCILLECNLVNIRTFRIG